MSSARNTGIAAVTGEFTAFLDFDDLWPEGRHRMMQRMLMDDPGLGAVFGRIRLKLEADAVLLDWVIDQDGKHTPGGCIGTALFRTRALHSIDGFNEGMVFAEDYDYFDRLRDAGMRYVLGDLDGLVYRRHAANCTNDRKGMQDEFLNYMRRRRRARATPDRLGHDRA